MLVKLFIIAMVFVGVAYIGIKTSNAPKIEPPKQFNGDNAPKIEPPKQFNGDVVVGLVKVVVGIILMVVGLIGLLN
jgi:hypothetical protein